MPRKEGNKYTDAHIRATRKYEAQNYWSPTLHLPKEYKQQILDTGQSVNSFIREAVEEKLKTVN
jgi:hypothetical protein